MWNWNSRLPFEENTYYHIYNRWYNKELILNNKLCFEHFHKLIIKYLAEYEKDLKIVSYSLLPNHFHFIIHNLNSDSKISDFMKKLQWAYSLWHRTKYPLKTGTKQAFFEWRFKAKHILDQEYLAKCLAYVNFNAVKHEIVENIEDYPRTSYHQIDKIKIENYKDLILDELEF